MRLSFLALIAAFILGSCKSSEEVTMNIKLEYNGEPLVMYKDYAYPDSLGTQVQFKRFSFFVSDMVLHIGEQMELVQEVDLYNLTQTHFELNTAEKGFEWTIPDSADDFDSVSFNLGITPEQNSMTPSDFSSDNALSRSVEYWSNWGSYVYIKIEGDADFNGDGEYGSGESFALHLGTDIVRRELSFDIENQEVSLVIDVDKIFDSGTSVYDLETYPKLHTLTPENLAQMEVLADNIVGAIRQVN